MNGFVSIKYGRQALKVSALSSGFVPDVSTDILLKYGSELYLKQTVTNRQLLVSDGFASEEISVENYDISGDTNVSVTTQVPALTSNSSTGLAFASSIFSASYDAYKAFDSIEDNTSGWFSSSNPTYPQYVGYIFNNPVASNKIMLRNRVTNPVASPESIEVQVSNDTTDGDNGTWLTLKTYQNTDNTAGAEWAVIFENVIRYKSYRIKVISSNYSTYVGVSEIKIVASNAAQFTHTGTISNPTAVYTMWSIG